MLACFYQQKVAAEAQSCWERPEKTVCPLSCLPTHTLTQPFNAKCRLLLPGHWTDGHPPHPPPPPTSSLSDSLMWFTLSHRTFGFSLTLTSLTLFRPVPASFPPSLSVLNQTFSPTASRILCSSFYLVPPPLPPPPLPSTPISQLLAQLAMISHPGWNNLSLSALPVLSQCVCLCKCVCICLSHTSLQEQCVAPSHMKWVMNQWVDNTIWAQSICRGWIFNSC